MANKVPMAFTTVQLPAVRRNRFPWQHTHKFSCKIGELVPCCVLDVLPNTTLEINCHDFVRMLPAVAPFYGRIDIKVEYWAVPYRLVWENAPDFFRDVATGGMPTFTMTSALSAAVKRFFAFMKVPPNTTANNVDISALYAACYQCIYSEHYRHQQTTAEVNYQLTDGNQSVGIFGTMRYRTWAPDYFTAALPFQQVGSAVDLPLGVISLKASWDATSTPFWDGHGTIATGAVVQNAGPSIDIGPELGPWHVQNAYDPDGSLQVDSTTIAELREAEALQKTLERLQRVGSRYTEFLWGMFGSDAKDYRLQRPELITTMKTPLMISEVLNTSDTATAPQGNMSGHGIASSSGYRQTYHCPEHMAIIGILSVVPVGEYYQGIQRMYLKTDPYQYGLPDFVHLSEQEIWGNEIFAYTATGGMDPWAYLPMYSEYRCQNSWIAGELTTTLDFWQAAREFSARPGFNQAFMEINPVDFDRLFADTDPTDKFVITHLNDIEAIVPLPVYGQPSM